MSVTLALAASLCGLAVGSDLRPEVDLLLSSGVRRYAYEDGPAGTFGEIWAIPRFALETEGRLTLRAAYGPRLFLPMNVSADAPDLRRAEPVADRVDVLHRADLRGGWRVDRRWRTGFRAEGAYGQTDLLAAGTWSPEAVPTTRRIQYLDTHLDVFLVGKVNPRSSLAFRAGAFTNGGASAAARATLPLQQGLRLSATLDWRPGRRGVLSALVSATGSRFTPGGEAAFARAGLRWQRDASRSLGLRAGAGAAATYARPPGSETNLRAAPWMEVGLGRDSEHLRRTWDVLGTVEPFIDRLSGTVDLRLGLDASLAWRLTPHWSVEARASAAALRPWGTLEPRRSSALDTHLFAIELRAGRGKGAHAMAAGVRAWGQDTTRTNFPSFLQWGGFFEVSLDSRARGAQLPSLRRR